MSLRTAVADAATDALHVGQRRLRIAIREQPLTTFGRRPGTRCRCAARDAAADPVERDAAAGQQHDLVVLGDQLGCIEQLAAPCP